MSCHASIVKIDLPDTKEGCTWDGLTWAITSVDADDTEYAAALSSAEFIATDSAGTTVLNLTSATSGQVTLTTTTANAWSVTVEPRILSLAAGFYSFALFTTDADSRRKPRWEATFRIHD